MSWDELARMQDGVIARYQLRACGLSAAAIATLIRTNALQRISRGLFVVRGAPITYRAELWHAALATDGALGFATAAHLWGLAEQPDRIEVIVDPARRITALPGVRQRRVFVPSSAVVRRDGLPVTTRAWTLLDHLGALPAADAYRLADRALQRSWLTVRDIEHRLAEFPGRSGNRRLRQVAARSGDGAAAESERILHRILRRAGVSRWFPNYPLWVDGGLVAVLDVALPHAHIAIEVDGWAYHSDVDRFQRDRQRQNALTSLGWTVLRFTWADLTQRPDYVMRTITRQLARAS